MGKYFNEIERYQLETMLKDGISKKEIAVRLHKSLATIYNEIKRGLITLRASDLTEYTIYQADVAQRDFLYKQTGKGSSFKIGNDYALVKFIEDKLCQKWSPLAIYGYFQNHKNEYSVSLSFKTIYNYIHQGIFLKYSSKKLVQYRKKTNGFKRIAWKNLRGVSIERRPEEIKERKNFGHWEMDTVVSGRGDRSCLLVLSERKYRFEIVRKIRGKNQEEVKRALDQLERKLGKRRFRSVFKTITTDNGVEFLNDEYIHNSPDGSRRTYNFYCHPYSSWERGTNENINKMIRKWIPKGSKISDFSVKQIKYIQNWINSYPRKILHWHSAVECLSALGIQLE